MVRLLTGLRYGSASSPHSRGDGPVFLHDVAAMMEFSPLAWGWSGQQQSRTVRLRVLPTRVGMVR